MKIQDSTIYPSPTLCIKPQALHMIAYKGYSSGNPTSTRGTTSSGSHWSSHGKFHVVSALFMVIDDKGGEKWTKIWIILGWQRGIWIILGWQRRRWECDHGHGSRGAILRRINILGQEEHTSRGSKLMNVVVCIWYVHIHALACICISFKIYICIACVWCMLVIELDWWFDN